MMRILLLVLFLCGPLVTSTQAYTANLHAYTDRLQVFAGESLELTLELNDPSYLVEPDLQPLKQNFQLLSSQRNIQPGSDKGAVQKWQFQLLPKHTGALQIPAIAVGRYRSNPIPIQVKNFQVPKALTLEPVYMDAQLDVEQVYVQAQAVLTLRIYHSLPIYTNSQLSTLSMENAQVIPLGEPHISEIFVNGVRHGVIEFRYAIFPQITGTLTIPSLKFSTTVVGHDPSSLEPTPGLPAQPVEVVSAQIPLQVQPPPKEFPATASWLPARDIQLQQDFSPQTERLQAGQALTRTLLIQATGQLAGSLPQLNQPSYPDFYSYADPLQRQQQVSEQGLLSEQQERVALIGQQSGQYLISGIELPWWNTLTDQLEYARLAEQTIQVDLGTPLSPPSPPGQNPLLIWQAISLLLLLSSLLFLLLWRKARRQPAIPTQTNITLDNSRLQESLRRACKSNHPAQARAALDALARNSDFSPNSAAMQCADFQHALNQLNAALYTDNPQHWQGDSLWQAFIRLNQATSATNSQPNTNLPPLYPP